jgi:hypothetical protein
MYRKEIWYFPSSPSPFPPRKASQIIKIITYEIIQRFKGGEERIKTACCFFRQQREGKTTID